MGLELNGGPALLVLIGGEPDSVMQVDVRGGFIQYLYIALNPDKLTSFGGAQPDRIR